MSAEIVFTLFHLGGAHDEIHTEEWPDIPIPRKGEYVTVGPVVHGFVYDVNYDLYVEGEQRRVYVCIPCDGDPIGIDCSWGCDEEHKRDHVDEVRQ